jgi:hypothetical protein
LNDRRDFDSKLQYLRQAAVTETKHVTRKLMNALEDDASADLDLSELIVDRRSFQGTLNGCHGPYGSYGPYSHVYPCHPPYYA